MIEACLFDLDGVIVDTAKYHYEAWKRLADHLEIPFTEEDNEKMKGISRIDSLELILELGQKELSDRDKQKYCATKNTWYLDMVQRMSKEEILPGVEELIRELQSNDIRIGLGSASRNAPKILDLVGLTSSFETIIDGNAVENSKPHPEVFLKGAEALDVAPSRTIVFEDSAKGIDAAKTGGFIAVGLGQEEHLGHADLVLPSLDGVRLSDIKEQLSILA